MHHPARDRTRFPNLDGVTQSGQVVGSRQPARTGADDEDLFPGRIGIDLEVPVVLEGHVTEKALDCVDADGAVRDDPVAGGLARVIADTTMDRRHRIIADELSPGAFEIAGLGQCEPGLDIFAGRAGIVTRWQQVHVLGTPRTQRTRTVAVARQVRAGSQVIGAHFGPILGASGSSSIRVSTDSIAARAC